MNAVVYRIFAARGRLLYVGCTTNLPRRLRRHKDWLRAYPGYRVEVSEPMPMEEARHAEMWAIIKEDPMRNVAHRATRYRQVRLIARLRKFEQAYIKRLERDGEVAA